MITNNLAAIVSFVAAHKVATLFVLFGAMVIEGESFLIISGVLIQLGALPLWEVVLIALSGVLVGDLLWYGLGVFLRNSVWASRYIRIAESIVARLLPQFREKPFISLVLAKYIYGTNHATLILSGVIGMDFWLFAKAEVVATVIWVSIYLAVGYIFGTAALLISQRVSVFLLIVVALIIGLIALQRYLTDYFASRGRNE